MPNRFLRSTAAAFLLACLLPPAVARQATPTQPPIGDPAPRIPGAPPPAIPARADADRQLKDTLVPLLVRHHTPALAAAVFDSHEIKARAAIGVRARSEPAAVTIDDRWHLGSCTKAITATLIGTLVEEKKLSWDTTLPQALPDAAPRMNDAFKKVTLAQLLRHRAGLAAFTDGGSPDFDMFKTLTGPGRDRRAAFVKELLSKPPALDPGGKFFYSNAGYAVAGAAAEHASGKAWDDLVRERVFKPLRMESAGFGWPASPDHPDQPRGHLTGPATRAQPLDPDYKLQTVLAPAGDVNCSIADFARFAQSHLQALRGADSIIKPDTARELHKPEGDYACGWGVRKLNAETAHIHNGSAGTFFTLMAILPDKDLGVVVATNTGEGQAACNEALSTILEMFAEAPAPAPQ